jgi:hypothetical protein
MSSISYKNQRLHYGMASNDWCWNCLGKYFSIPMMLSGSLPSDKMGYYMGVLTSLS